jgi:hypothetical protein
VIKAPKCGPMAEAILPLPLVQDAVQLIALVPILRALYTVRDRKIIMQGGGPVPGALGAF